MPQRRKQTRVHDEESSYPGDGDEVEDQQQIRQEGGSDSRNNHQQPQQHHRSQKNRSDKQQRHRRRLHSNHSEDAHERTRRYLYSAISATFLFVLLREIGWIDQMQSVIHDAQMLRLQQQEAFLTKSNGNHGNHGHGGNKNSINLAAAANMAATSMKFNNQNNNNQHGGTGAGGFSSETSLLLQNPKNFVSRSEMMDYVTQADHTITPGSRPIMYTFFEWIPPRSRGTSMSDVADKKLIAEWKAAWKAAGWHPIVLTLEDAKKHPQYNDYSPKLNKIPMLGVDGLGGTVVYNQLCFLRWLAVAAVGGGYMCDYDVFPIAKAPTKRQQQQKQQQQRIQNINDGEDSSSAAAAAESFLPYNGNFTVYSRIKHSKRAGIPCLMSGRADEWTRLAYELLENGKKNSGTESMWSDMLALIDMRNDNTYDVYDQVLEGQDVLLKTEWTEADCNKTASKQAIHFSHEAMKLGYLAPGETAEDRPEIVKRFLTKWHQVCDTSTTAGDADMEEVAQESKLGPEATRKEVMKGSV